MISNRVGKINNKSLAIVHVLLVGALAQFKCHHVSIHLADKAIIFIACNKIEIM